MINQLLPTQSIYQTLFKRTGNTLTERNHPGVLPHLSVQSHQGDWVDFQRNRPVVKFGSTDTTKGQAMKELQELKEIAGELYDLEGISGLEGWDNSIYRPEGG